MPRTVSKIEIATQTDDQHVEGTQGPVYQHLVDDHLEEQRRDQGE